MTNRASFRLSLLAITALVVTPGLASLIPRARAAQQPQPITGPRVHYYRAENVAKSFAEGAVLFAEPGVNYMIHTSQRTAAGVAEVHTQDTDLIHVLEGAATFVTGGAVVEPKTVAPDEIRGASIDGGETRVLGKGDVIIVPAGTPHWFKEVRGPVLYYTVKVRPGVKS